VLKVAKFEVLTAVSLSIQLLWDVMLWSWVSVLRRFERL